MIREAKDPSVRFRVQKHEHQVRGVLSSSEFEILSGSDSSECGSEDDDHTLKRRTMDRKVGKRLKNVWISRMGIERF